VSSGPPTTIGKAKRQTQVREASKALRGSRCSCCGGFATVACTFSRLTAARNPLLVGANDAPRSDVGEVALREFVVGVVMEDY
jgi:hypothetical protein